MTMPTQLPTSDEPDYYALIGVTPATPPDEIRRVYGERVRGAMDSDDRALFERLVAAFEVLKDDEKRQAYDKRRVSAPPTREATQMNRTVLPPPAAPPPSGNTTQMMPPSATLLGGMGGERTTLFTGTPGSIPLPTVCAIGLSPCPLIGRAVLPDEGFCPECGVQLGVTLGAEVATVRLPFLRDEAGREYSLRAGENTVGRDGADVMLPDKSVSRRHARLNAALGNLSVEDLGSTNGTKHRGAPVVAGQSLPLSDGDPIQFGGIKLVAVVPASAEMLALPSPKSAAERTILPALAAPEGVNMAARLVGKDGTIHTLTGDRTTFGRRAGNTVVLSGDSFVSGNHGAVLYEGETFRVVDLGSTNGSKLNGKKLAANAPQVLSHGDEVTFGQTTFTFHAPGK